MNKIKVKGFTLIELIVVMAIFMIVLVAAMSLMDPVQKMVIQADVRESGAAEVNSISNYLQTELGSVEYLMVTNDVIRDGSNNVQEAASKNMVKDYVKRYYEGVLKKGATTDAPIYGSGKVHVLTIDNSKGGEIVKQVYEVSFAPGAAVGNRLSYQRNVINKAYYDNTTYQIDLAGSMMNAPIENVSNMTAFVNNISASDTTFNIIANITRGTANPKTYTFSTSATVPLVNIMERSGPVTGRYFVIRDTNVGQPNESAEIVDLGVASGIGNPSNPARRSMNGTATLSSIYCSPQAGKPTSGPDSKYTFVYSYGSEMLTS